MNPRTALRRQGSARAPARWFQYRSTIPSSSKARSWGTSRSCPLGNQSAPPSRSQSCSARAAARTRPARKSTQSSLSNSFMSFMRPSDGPLPSGHQKYRRPGRAWTRAGDQTIKRIVDVESGRFLARGSAMLFESSYKDQDVVSDQRTPPRFLHELLFRNHLAGPLR
jgi:hypothetical protein